MNFNNVFKNDEILDYHVQEVLNSYFTNPNIDNPLKYNFRCNVCGDSKKSKKKRRGYILKDKDPWMYFCHNCGYSSPVTIWLKEFFPLNYKQYIKESLMKNTNETQKKKDDVIVKYFKNKSEIKKSEKELEKEDVKHFVPILKGSSKLFQKALKICKERMIPEDIYKTWYVAVGGSYKNRMIIPFYDNKGSIYYYQGRALYRNMLPKYMSRRGDFNNIYNYFTVDKNKEIIILEGLIDSIFVENSIAMTGLKIEDMNLNKFSNKRFLLDSDKSGRKKSNELLIKGEYVFNWKKFIKEFGLPNKSKWDINDVCRYLNRKEPFTYDELEVYFTNNSNDRIYFL